MATITAAAGGGNWTAGGTWVGGVAPTAADDAVLDATSGNVTIDTGAVCRSLNCTGYIGTLTHTVGVTLTIGDATAGTGSVALLFSVGMTYAKGSTTTSAVSFVSTSATTQTITSAGKSFGNFTINGASSSYQLTDAHNLAATAASVTLTAGTFDTNGQTCIWGVFSSSNSNSRTLTLGASSVSCTGGGGGGTAWNCATSTNLTLNAGTSTITLSASTVTFSGGGRTYNAVVFSGAGVATIDNTGATFANLTRTGTATKTDALVFNTNHTITGMLTLTGNSILNRLQVSTSVLGSVRTLTAGALNASYVDFRDIGGAGTADWNLSAISGGSGDCGNNTGITFTPAATQYWFQDTGNWSDSTKWFLDSAGTGGVGRVPLPQDDVVFDANSFSTAGQVVTGNMNRSGKNITWATVTNSPTWTLASTGVISFGSLTLHPGMTFNGAFTYTLEGRNGSFTITSAGKAFPGVLNFQSAGSTYALQDNLSVTGQINQNYGIVSATTQNVQAASYNGNNNNTKTLTMGSGTWTMTGTGNVWRLAPGGTTLNAGTSTLIFTDTSASSKTFNGSTSFVIAPYYRISIPGGGTGAIIFGSNATFNTIDIGAPKSVTFPAGATINVTNFNLVGNPGNLITVTSSTSSTAATLSKTSGTVACDYLSLRDSTAIGGAIWYAGANSTNVSGNTGWIFSSAPSRGGTQNMMGV